MKARDPMLIHRGEFPRFTREEEAELAVRAKGGDQSARTALVESQLAYGLQLLRRYRTHYRNQDAEVWGCILAGIALAVDRFDPARGRLTTAVTVWVRQQIQRAVSEEWNLIRVPLYLYQALRAEDRGVPLPDDLKGQGFIRQARIAMSAGAKGLARSEPDDDLLALVPDREPEEMEEEAGRIGEYLDQLPERWAHVIRLSFGIGIPEPITNAEIGRSMGLCRERIRQIEAKGLARLRKLMGAA